MFVDSHAHIYAEEFATDRSQIIDKAYESGIHQIVMPNVDHTSIEGMMELEMRYPNRCIATMGLHPCYVKKDFEKELYIVEDWLSKRSFAAIGEIGIDLYWDKTFFSQQQEAFKIQLSLAHKYNKPVIIHCRNSFRETMDLIKSVKQTNQKGVFHCFSGTVEEAKEVIEMGFHIGIGGVATFKNGGLDKVLPEIKLENILLETDSPYLAPVPHRGKRNEPSYITIIADKVALLTNSTLEEVAYITTKNSVSLFQLN